VARESAIARSTPGGGRVTDQSFELADHSDRLIRAVAQRRRLDQQAPPGTAPQPPAGLR
jgi:hypothetical protein